MSLLRLLVGLFWLVGGACCLGLVALGEGDGLVLGWGTLLTALGVLILAPPRIRASIARGRDEFTVGVALFGIGVGLMLVASAVVSAADREWWGAVVYVLLGTLIGARAAQELGRA